MSRSHLLETNGFNQLAQARDGYYLYNRNDIYIGKAIEKYGEYNALEFMLLKQLCGPGNIVIEVGANIGTHTVPLAKHIGEHGRLLAFEPQRLVFQTLCANIALNSLENVDCFWAALGRAPGSITVPEIDPNMETNLGGVSLLDARDGGQVDCFTLDSVLSKYLPLPFVKLIKIDVEGMEYDVISGGRQIIQEHKPFLYVENDRPEKSETLMRLIDSLGYRMFWHIPLLFNPNNYYAYQENIYPNISSFNMICIHRETQMDIENLGEITDFTAHPLRKN